MKRKRVLITGGHGFVGQAIIKRLINSEAEIMVLTRKESVKSKLKEYKGKYVEQVAEKEDYSDIRKKLQEFSPRIIYHLASYGGHYRQQEPELIYRTNLMGTFYLLEALKDVPYEMFVNTGSSSEYGFKRKRMSEADLPEPVSLYASSKAGASLLVQAYAKVFRKPAVTFRLFTVYGPGDNPDKFIPTAIRVCLTGKELKLVSSTSKHDFVYIDDIAEAFIKAGALKASTGEIINLGSGKQFSNNQIVSMIERISKKKIMVSRDSYEQHYWDTDFWVADNRKAKKLLGWVPKVGIREGLEKTVDYELAH